MSIRKKAEKLIGIFMTLCFSVVFLGSRSSADTGENAYRIYAGSSGIIAQGFEITEEEAERIESSIEKDIQASAERFVFTPRAASYAISGGNGSTNYFYLQLSAKEKALYDSIQTAAEEFYSSNTDLTDDHFAIVDFTPSGFTKAEIEKIYNLFYHSNPKYFFTYAAYSYSLSAGKLYPMIIDKFKTASVRNTYKSQIESVTASWLSEIRAVSGDREREQIIYTKLIDKITYTHNTPYDQSLAAALVDGACVCNGYAQAMVYLCNLADIDCIMTVSKEHAWNIVKLDGSWYIIDVTWMDQGANGVWSTWCNVPTYAKVKQQDQNNYHTYLSTLYTGITLPDGNSDNAINGGSSSGGASSADNGTAGGVKSDSALTIKSSAVIPTLKITVPKTLSFVTNPYRLSVDGNGKVGGSGAVSNSYIVPVYGTGNSAWNITNISGTGITCVMYATVTNNNPSQVEIRDANNGGKNAVTGEEVSDDKRVMVLALSGKAGNSGSDTPIPFSPALPATWSEASGCTKFGTIPDGEALALTIDTDECRCYAGSGCTDTKWTAKDTAVITMAFRFDFVV